MNECFTLLGKRLEPTNIYLNCTTSSFFISWSPPNTDSELVSEYEVNWRVLGTAGQTSGRLSKSKSKYSVSNGLISGQLYIVNVVSHVSLTSPTKQIPVVAPDTTVRTSMKFDITAFTAWIIENIDALQCNMNSENIKNKMLSISFCFWIFIYDYTYQINVTMQFHFNVWGFLLFLSLRH